MKPGTFHAMLKQLDIRERDLQEAVMRSFTYPARLAADASGGYVVTCRDVPEAITQGDTVDQALTEAADALDEALHALGGKVEVRAG